MWILILTLVVPGHSTVSASVSSVAGFTSDKSCMDAGLAYEKSLGAGLQKVKFICVKA